MASILTACSTPVINTAVPTIEDFPVAPSVTEYTRKPIIEKQGNNYLVTDEFVTNSVLLKKYSDRVDAWKKDNGVN